MGRSRPASGASFRPARDGATEAGGVAFYLYDVFASIMGWDHGLSHPARDCMRVRAARPIAMQARFPDGHMYLPTEPSGAYPNDQFLAWQIGDALLLQWLNAQGEGTNAHIMHIISRGE